MQKITWIMAMTGVILFLSCGKGNEQSKSLTAKKEALESLKKKQAALAIEIKKLEDEIRMIKIEISE